MADTNLIRDFVNTRDLLDDGELFTTPDALGEWLASQGLAARGVRASAGDLRHAIELREALRQILLANTGVEVDTVGPFGVVHAVAKRARIELCFDECAGRLVAEAPGVAGALGRIVIGINAAMADGSWARIKACRAVDCEWAFIDTSKNHSRAWCSMQVCGNREKARSFRERHRAGEGGSSSSR